MATRETLSPKEAECSSGADYAALALEALQEPADPAYARELVDRIADDCQFTKDLVAVAIVYKQLGDQARAEELLQTAEDYCMSGEEQVYLAEGKMKVLGDRAGAEAALDKALKETNNLDPLIELGRQAAELLGDSAFAKKVFEKAEAKLSRAAEYTRLAAAAVEHLKDKDYAGAILEKGAARLTNVADLLQLAGETARTLGDPAKARALYQRALGAATDFNAVKSLLDAARAINETEFMQAVLKKGGELATATEQFIDLARALKSTGDAAGAAKLMDQAENAVASLDEMSKVVEAAKTDFADDTARLARVQAKYDKRAANQAKYVEFGKQEELADTPKKLFTLADQVMAELEDPFYAAKLLGKVEAMLDTGDYQFLRYRPLILAVDKHVNDAAWVARLLDTAAAKSGDFVWFKEVVKTAATALKNKELGREKARAYVQQREASIKSNPEASVYDYTKLAELVIADIGDAAWGAQLLNEARARAKDHYALAHVAALMARGGDAAGAEAVLMQAAQVCGNADCCIQLATRVKNAGFDAALVRKVYEACGNTLTSPADKLHWVEGIVDELKDKAWASEAYAAIEGQFTGEARARFEVSRMNRVGDEFYPYRKHAA
ncbi:MAG: hypothetical protein AB1591_05655 [Pseudomonadota bacterium]